jgi:hypothetical protein
MSRTKRQQAKYCAEPNCSNPPAKHRRVCLGCKARKYRENNKVSTAFFQLRQNARRRGIPFLLSFTYFRKLVLDNNYMELRGRGKEDMTIDRKIPRLGYSDGNLQIISNSQNALKRWHEPIYGSKEIAGTPF